MILSKHRITEALITLGMVFVVCKPPRQVFSRHGPYYVVSGIEVKPCIKICKPLVVYRFSCYNNVLYLLENLNVSMPKRDSSYCTVIIMLFVCFVALRPKSTAKVIAGKSVHLTTLFSWAGLNKRLTSNSCTYFRL